MTKDNRTLLEDLVKSLSAKIDETKENANDEYFAGVIDGLIIAIRTIEG